MNSDWRSLLPKELGPLPFDGVLTRTEANGSIDAPVTVLGVYPAAVQWRHFVRDGVRLNLPSKVEEHSFDPLSKSGSDLDKLYLQPLGLSRGHILAVDLMPYFFANTAKDSKSHRSMWDNVRDYTRITGRKTAIEPRPPEDKLLQRCWSLPGNQSRLQEYIARKSARLLFTLGREAAAYVRGHNRAIDGQQYLYSKPKTLDLFDNSILTVHFVHPGNLQRSNNGKWKTTHIDWCIESGRGFVKSVLG
ncbi:MAG: hypothetical protein WEF53_04000 [Bacteroidota bacterium]